MGRFKSFKSYLITGGCGFIGINLIAHLLKENPEVKIRVLDNLSVGTREDLAEVCSFTEIDISHLTPHIPYGTVELIVGDIRDYSICLNCCEGIDVVVHLAASTGVVPSVEDPRQNMEENVIGTFNLLESARHKKVDRFIFASSGAPIGEVEPPIKEDKPARPVSPYGASKLAGEGYCSAYYRTFGLKTISLRFGNVYGPRSKNKNSVIARFFKQAINGGILEIYGDGNQTRDFIYIDDLIHAICLAINPLPLTLDVSRSLSKEEPWGEIFQIATCKETSIKEIAEAIKDIVEKETNKKITVIYREPRLGDVRRNYSDISKAKEMLGYEPRFDLKSGLRKTFDYFKKVKRDIDEIA